jgi:hypothetical protein
MHVLRANGPSPSRRSDDHQASPTPAKLIECHVTLGAAIVVDSQARPRLPYQARAVHRSYAAFQLLCRANSTYFRLQSHNLEYRLPESTLQGHSCFRGCAIAPAAQICAFQLRCTNATAGSIPAI